jgi:hypothetical protein
MELVSKPVALIAKRGGCHDAAIYHAVGSAACCEARTVWGTAARRTSTPPKAGPVRQRLGRPTSFQRRRHCFPCRPLS